MDELEIPTPVPAVALTAFEAQVIIEACEQAAVRLAMGYPDDSAEFVLWNFVQKLSGETWTEDEKYLMALEAMERNAAEDVQIAKRAEKSFRKQAQKHARKMDA